MAVKIDDSAPKIAGTFSPSTWLTTEEAAQLVGYSSGSVLRHAIRRGDIVKGTDAIKRGNRWFVRLEAVHAYYEAMLAEFAARRPPYRGPLPEDEPPA
jgi:hypothetical protein